MTGERQKEYQKKGSYESQPYRVVAGAYYA